MRNNRTSLGFERRPRRGEGRQLPPTGGAVPAVRDALGQCVSPTCAASGADRERGEPRRHKRREPPAGMAAYTPLRP